LAMMAAPAVAQLSGARVREELFAIFEEEDPERILARLHQLGVDAQLDVEFPQEPTDLQQRLRELDERYAVGRSRAHLGLLSIRAPDGWLDDIKVTRRIADGVEAAHREEPFLRSALAVRPHAPSEVVDAVERTGPDTALYTLARGEDPAL